MNCCREVNVREKTDKSICLPGNTNSKAWFFFSLGCYSVDKLWNWCPAQHQQLFALWPSNWFSSLQCAQQPSAPPSHSNTHTHTQPPPWVWDCSLCNSLPLDYSICAQPMGTKFWAHATMTKTSLLGWQKLMWVDSNVTGGHAQRIKQGTWLLCF